MRKLLILKSELLPYSETFIKEQALACSRWHPTLVGRRRVSGLNLDELDVRLLRLGLPANLENVFWHACCELDVAVPGVRRKLEREKASLLHAHFGNEAVIFWPVVRRLGLPLVVTLHGSDINIRRDWREKHGGRASRKYPRRLIDVSRSPRVSFVAVSEAVRQRAILFGLPEDRIKVLYIGVDIGKFSADGPPITERPRRILCTGRMVEKKGGRYLLEAFARVRARIPDAELVMIGAGPLSAELKLLAETLKVPVEFTGSLPASEVKRHLDGARVFCLPSLTAGDGDAEGFGIVLLEAQASGVPVVTSAMGGATEGVLHGETGFAFAEKDIDAMAEYLCRILMDDELARSMSVAARRFVAEKFNLKRCTSALEDHYDALVSV
jgi:glycosyltransferase involved in cell wall biosynthesis